MASLAGGTPDSKPWPKGVENAEGEREEEG